MKISMEEIQEAQNLIDHELFDSMDYGRETTLTQNLSIYKYQEEDIYVLMDLNTYIPLFQILKTDTSILLEEI